MEASEGIEPPYKDLQSSASPLRHEAIAFAARGAARGLADDPEGRVSSRGPPSEATVVTAPVMKTLAYPRDPLPPRQRSGLPHPRHGQSPVGREEPGEPLAQGADRRTEGA